MPPQFHALVVDICSASLALPSRRKMLTDHAIDHVPPPIARSSCGLTWAVPSEEVIPVLAEHMSGLTALLAPHMPASVIVGWERTTDCAAQLHNYVNVHRVDEPFISVFAAALAAEHIHWLIARVWDYLHYGLAKMVVVLLPDPPPVSLSPWAADLALSSPPVPCRLDGEGGEAFSFRLASSRVTEPSGDQVTRWTCFVQMPPNKAVEQYITLVMEKICPQTLVMPVLLSDMDPAMLGCSHLPHRELQIKWQEATYHESKEARWPLSALPDSQPRDFSDACSLYAKHLHYHSLLGFREQHERGLENVLAFASMGHDALPAAPATAVRFSVKVSTEDAATRVTRVAGLLSCTLESRRSGSIILIFTGPISSYWQLLQLAGYGELEVSEMNVCSVSSLRSLAGRRVPLSDYDRVADKSRFVEGLICAGTFTEQLLSCPPDLVATILSQLDCLSGVAVYECLAAQLLTLCANEQSHPLLLSLSATVRCLLSFVVAGVAKGDTPRLASLASLHALLPLDQHSVLLAAQPGFPAPPLLLPSTEPLFTAAEASAVLADGMLSRPCTSFLPFAPPGFESVLARHRSARLTVASHIDASLLRSKLLYGTAEERLVLYCSLSAATTSLSDLQALSEEFVFRLAMMECTPAGRRAALRLLCCVRHLTLSPSPLALLALRSADSPVVRQVLVDALQRVDATLPAERGRGLSVAEQSAQSRSKLTTRNVPKAKEQASFKPARRHHVDLPFFEIVTAYMSYAILTLFAFIHEWTMKMRTWVTGKSQWSTPKGYAPLMKDFEYFFTRHMYGPIRDCWDRTITSAPSAHFDVAERIGINGNETFHYTGRVYHALNLGSYNYLGFSETDSKCTDDVLCSVAKYGTSTTSTQLDLGRSVLHTTVEARTAAYIGKEAAIVFPMGYATNSTVLPSLIGRGGLIISDAMNHASAIMGCRTSGAKITVFRHNDPSHLEKVLRKAIAEGQPRTHKPWTKILIVVEGIYSMEGEILALKEIVQLKKKYRAYLYVDEAHSVGAIGPHGRGVCDYAGVDPADVDILMGTFTKSFASVGGYIAASQPLVDHLRHTAFSSLYDTTTSMPCCQQIISALDVITNANDGQRRIRQIYDNSVYFRTRLTEMGFLVLGNSDSPVVPVLLGSPGKVCTFSRECLKRNLAVVVVGFPATPLIQSRARFCMSAGHTRQDLDFALKIIEEVGDICMVRYNISKVRPVAPPAEAKDAVHATGTRKERPASAAAPAQ